MYYGCQEYSPVWLVDKIDTNNLKNNGNKENGGQNGLGFKKQVKYMVIPHKFAKLTFDKKVNITIYKGGQEARRSVPGNIKEIRQALSKGIDQDLGKRAEYVTDSLASL